MTKYFGFSTNVCGTMDCISTKGRGYRVPPLKPIIIDKDVYNELKEPFANKTARIDVETHTYFDESAEKATEKYIDFLKKLVNGTKKYKYPRNVMDVIEANYIEYVMEKEKGGKREKVVFEELELKDITKVKRKTSSDKDARINELERKIENMESMFSELMEQNKPKRGQSK